MVNINPNLLLNQTTAKTASAYNATQTDAEVESATSSGPDDKIGETKRNAVWINPPRDGESRNGDVWINGGRIWRYQLDSDGCYRYMQDNKIYQSDFESGRGDIRC